MDELIFKFETMLGINHAANNRAYLLSLIESACEEVRNVRYPNGASDEETQEIQTDLVMKRFGYNILRIAQYHYDKQGIEGVTSYTEADVKRHYESAGTPISYFNGINPIASVY